MGEIRTLDYYDENALDYSESTRSLDMREIQETFLSMLEPGSAILDLGCGSGRDSRTFLRRGYDVSACDGSQALAKVAGEYTGLRVRTLLFEDLDYEDKFDGIWACSSLLHLTPESLRKVFRKINIALRPNGVFYCSFKYGTTSGYQKDRWFTNLDENKFRELTADISGFEVLRMWRTEDKRKDRPDTKWLNVMMSKGPMHSWRRIIKAIEQITGKEEHDMHDYYALVRILSDYAENVRKDSDEVQHALSLMKRILLENDYEDEAEELMEYGEEDFEFPFWDEAYIFPNADL